MANRVRVLVLDDDPDRHAWVRALYPNHEIVHAYRYHETIALLETESFDLFHVDHDLHFLRDDADVKYCESLDPFQETIFFDGRDVAEWLLDHGDRCPKHVYIHSRSCHAKEMERLIRFLPGVRVERKQAPT